MFVNHSRVCILARLSWPAYIGSWFCIGQTYRSQDKIEDINLTIFNYYVDLNLHTWFKPFTNKIGCCGVHCICPGSWSASYWSWWWPIWVVFIWLSRVNTQDVCLINRLSCVAWLRPLRKTYWWNTLGAWSMQPFQIFVSLWLDPGINVIRITRERWEYTCELHSATCSI